MPTTYRQKDRSTERAYQTAMDWALKALQLSALATLLLYGYLFYGLFLGGIGDWATLTRPQQLRIASNVETAVLWLNIAIGLLLVTACFLYYDEETLGYTLVTSAIVLYYGLPFLFDQLMPDQVAQWGRTNNTAALMIMGQFRTAALILAVPGAILVVRDLILRMVDGSRRNREQFSAMQYGGSVREEAPVGTALVGMFAKCWQLSFCREAIRKRCPIYHARTRCWRERVGCMCEENVIRRAMDAIIHKEDIPRDDPFVKKEAEADTSDEGFISFDKDFSAPEETAEEPTSAAQEKTTEIRKPEFVPPPPKKVRIPHNPNLPMSIKMERCRNCVIYNEHQRLKYQFFAPIAVLTVPALAVWKMDVIAQNLSSLMARLDRLLANLSLERESANTGIVSSITSTSTIAQYIVIGCLIIIATTMVLRALEFLIFKWKI